MVKKAVRIQNMIKKYLWQKRLEKIKEKAEKSVTMISNWIKMMKQRRTYLEIRANIIRLQANCRFQISTAAFLRQKQCE